MLTYLPTLICFNQTQHTEVLQYPRTSDPSGSPLSSRNWMACGNEIASKYRSDQTSQPTTASLQACMQISSNATPPQVRCHDSKLVSSYRASKCSNISTTTTHSAPHRAVQPLGLSSPLLLRKIWNFTALTLHRQANRLLDGRFFISPPPGFTHTNTSGIVYEMLRLLYGVPYSPRALHKTLDCYFKRPRCLRMLDSKNPRGAAPPMLNMLLIL